MRSSRRCASCTTRRGWGRGRCRLAPSEDDPCVLVADAGYHARQQLKALDGGVWKTRIAEPEPARSYLA